MAVKIIIEHKDPSRILDIVKELRATGLSPGKDFDFAYNPPTEDWMNGVQTTRYTTFTFYEEKYSTLFALKYLS